jgi:HEAT repeat protein
MVSQDYANQPFAVNLLAHLKSGAEPAIPALLQMLENTNNPVRSWASSALWQIHRQPSLVIPALTKSLADTNQFVRFESARALGIFGPEAKAALPHF